MWLIINTCNYLVGVADHRLIMAEGLPYRYLGSTGLKVSSVCLGTMTFGKKEGTRPGQSDQVTAETLLDKFVEIGGNFIDTADIYQMGESETIIGQFPTLF